MKLRPSRYLLGTTAEAVLANDNEYESEPAVAIWMASLPNAKSLLSPLSTPKLLMVVLFWDGQTTSSGRIIQQCCSWQTISFPVDELIARLEEDRPGLPIIRGMASVGTQPGTNTLVINGETYESGGCGIILGGGVRVRPVVSQGCRPIGIPLVVTKAEDNMLVELGGRPAFIQLRAIMKHSMTR